MEVGRVVIPQRNGIEAKRKTETQSQTALYLTLY